MKKLFFSIALFSATFFQVSAQQQVYVGTEEYDALKASGLLDSPDVEILGQEGTNIAIHPQVFNAGDGVQGRDAECGCWVQPDATYTLAGFPSNPNVDDGSTNQIPLPFTFCLYGDNYNSFFINTNGNITFGNAFGTFTPQGFPMGTAMVAPFWGDVDLSCNTCGDVFYKVTADAVYVNWIDVAYYADHTDKINNFQVIISNGANDFVGAGKNVAFCYKDMQWTTGDASGGQGGFGGSSATVGANRGNNNNFVQFGRFSVNSLIYDGPFGLDDGVNWLDNKSFIFNACLDQGNNIPPIASGANVCDTITLCQNATFDLTLQFLSPEGPQLTNLVFDAGGMLGITDLEIINGNTASFSCTITGNAQNIGVNELTFTATDNGSPVGVTTITIFVEVTEDVAPPFSISGALEFCSGESTILTASPGYDEYIWSNGCIGNSCEVSQPGTITINAILGECIASATVTPLILPYFLPPVSITDQPICSNDSTLVLSVNAYDSYQWSNYLGYPGTIYSDDTDQQTVYLSSGTFVLTVLDGACQGERIFNITSANATIPQDTWSGAYCDGLEELDFCCGYATAQGGNFWLYMFNTNCNWANANGSLDIFVNGELVLENVQAPNCGTPLWTPSFQVFFGDYVEIYYDPGNSTGTQSLQILNCSNSPMNLTPIPLTGPGLIWAGIAACPSSPPIGYWEIIDGPPGAEFSDETQFNSDFSPGDYGTYDLHFFSETCGIDYYYEVIYSGPISVDLVSEINECGGGGDPILLSPVYENPLNDAEIEWTTGATSPNLTVTQSGTYCVTISNGCGSDEACVEVLIDPIPALSLNDDYPLCDETSLSLDPIAIDDDSYEYTWSGPGFNSSSPTVVITESGTYTVIVTNDCGTDNATFDVLLDPTPVLGEIEDAYILCDEPSLFLDPITNDDPSFSYSWTGPGFNSSDPEETLSQNGSYTVTVTNECGTVSAEFDLTVVSELTVSVNSLNLCDEPTGTLVATANQPVGYLWDNGETTSNIEVNSTGDYCVTVANACETQNDCGTVSLNFTPNITMNLNSVDNLCPGIDQVLSGNAGSANGVSWTWSVECGGGSSALDVSGSQLAVSGDLANANCLDGFTVLITANNNCGTDAASVDITLDPCLVDFPNVITPNDDGINDAFVIEGLESYYAFGGVKLQVFNRWGNLVYETDKYENDWEGDEASAGTYYFIVILPNGDVTKGDLTIIKN